jgi:ATP-binding cassette subfamily F protein 3
MLLVSHDRDLLNKVVDRIVHLEERKLTLYTGGYDRFERTRSERLEHQAALQARQVAQRRHMQAFVDRFRYKASKARQAQDRVKKLGKIERIERDPRDQRELAFSFKPVERSGRVVFELIDGRVEVPGRTLLDGAKLWLERGEHVSLIGPNGSGKTTLISALTGQRELDAGKLRRGHNVKLGVLSQHAEELDSTANVLEAAQRATKLTPPKARALLGQFMFSGEAAEKPVEGLSGGERRRLSLAILVHSGANVLILDEPTNHLDLESREALEAALDAFPGTILLVSHDRALLDAIADRTLALEDGTIRSYDGGWAEYVAARDARLAPAEPEPSKPKREKPKPKTTSRRKGPTELERLEAEIAGREAEIADLERQLAEDWSNLDVVAAHRRARDELKSLLARWEELFETA